MRTRDRLGLGVVRAPARDGRPGQRRLGPRDGSRQPRAARRRRPAGPPAPRARAVPRRAPRRARGRVPRWGSPGRRARRTCRARSRAPTTRRWPAAALLDVVVEADPTFAP